jgi:hypothetical protein
MFVPRAVYGNVMSQYIFMNHTNFLAWYKYPEPEGRSYSGKELEDTFMVLEIFDYCQILLAVISKEGWKKLIEFHGIEKLLEVNEISGWFDNSTYQDAIDGLKYECLISGYNPESNAYGEYDEKNGIFTNSQGKTTIVEWGIPWLFKT